jgi:hypothetical protein
MHRRVLDVFFEAFLVKVKCVVVKMLRKTSQDFVGRLKGEGLLRGALGKSGAHM